jgi:hypothetical protein
MLAVISLAGMSRALAADAIGDEDVLANPIVNGGFERPVVPGGTLRTFSPGGTNIQPWRVIGSGCGNVAVVSRTYTRGGIRFAAQAGNQYLDLTGNTNNGCPTGVQQSVSTTAGNTYELTFWVGNAYDPERNWSGARVDVYVNDILATSVINTGGAANPTQQFWRPFTYRFKATTARTLIAFLNGAYFSRNSGLDSVSLTDVTSPSEILGFSGGTINSNYSPGPVISQGNTTLQLTDNGPHEAGSWFNNQPRTISTFSASFDYQVTGGTEEFINDGMAFILQNSSAGPHALGQDGGGLGVSGISPSAEVEFYISPAVIPPSGTNFATNGSVGNYKSTDPINFRTHDLVHIALSYNGTILTEHLTDPNTGGSYSTSYTVNIPAILGSSIAYIGFSAATGDFTSTQTLSNFAFHSSTTTVRGRKVGAQ